MVKNLFYFFILLNIFLSFFFLYTELFLNSNDRIYRGSVNCYDKGVFATCIYKNIFFYNNEWQIYIDKINNFKNICINSFSRNLGKCWNVKIVSIDKIHNEVNHIDNFYKDISIPFKLTYKFNYGHALWDDLYSIYTSLVKLGYENKKFNLIIHDKFKFTHYLNDIYSTFERFSKGSNIFLSSIVNKTILFKYLIVGSSHQCQRCITLDYSLKYSREYNITKKLRDRMFSAFNIKPDYEYPINGIIVHNKRYNKYEVKVLKNITTEYENSNMVRLNYIDFKRFSSFYEQLKYMSKVHLYISGPGTGLLNFPFMADPGVVIHLGHIHFGCPQYLEQYILEGSPHIKAFYYSSLERMKILNHTYINYLIENAINYLLKNRNIYIKKRGNLNEEGKLFVKICEENKDICEEILKKYDWGYGKCRGIWAENVIYFPLLYKKVLNLKRIIESYNSSSDLGCKVGINYSKQDQWC